MVMCFNYIIGGVCNNFVLLFIKYFSKLANGSSDYTYREFV